MRLTQFRPTFQKQTHTIGVIVPNLDYVLSMMVKGIDEVALEAGYTVMVCQSNESFGREIVNTSRLLESLVDGFIISVSSETKTFDHIRKIHDRKIPIVLFDRLIPNFDVPGVRLDNEEGGFIATEHLIEQGYKRIAILAGPKNLGISNSRLEGYLNALKKHKIKRDDDLIMHCDFNQDYAYFATQELLSMKKRPDAIFTISDRMAIGAMLAIKKKKLNMPEDIVRTEVAQHYVRLKRYADEGAPPPSPAMAPGGAPQQAGGPAAVYQYGDAGGVQGAFFRSLDAGASWARINDAQTQFGCRNKIRHKSRKFRLRQYGDSATLLHHIGHFWQ
jgi:hypothetical protein